jgi:phytoene dehydrogenase-like protein
MCIGGSARLAGALIADIREHAGEVRTNVEIRAILTHNGRATGVELTTGERIEAKTFVASSLNPQQTFLDLLNAGAAPQDLRDRARGFQYNLLAPLFALNVALHEPLQYTAAVQRPELARAFMVILGLERFSQFSEIVRAHERGEFPPPVMWGACPTLFDPTQAPAGKHTAFMWEKLPYALRGSAANWDPEKEIHARRMLGRWAQYAPNLAEGAVIDWFCRSPLDTERKLPNMRFGDLLVGSFANGQTGYNRPFPGAGEYRTPIEGLYLCGGSTHPGGNITGLCGYNAASVVASDLGLRLWWNPRSAETALQRVE